LSPEPAVRQRRAKRLLLAVLGFTMLAVTRPVDTNANLWSRLSVTFSIVERGEFDIGPYMAIASTPDWAVHDGRYYSNKAPGPSLLAVPLFAAQHAIQERVGVPAGSLRSYRIGGWLANAFIGVLPTLLALSLLWTLFERRYGFTPLGAFGMTALAGAASLSLPYATMLFAHQTAAAVLAIGTVLTLLEATQHDRPRPVRIGFAGLVFGLAVLADHMAAIGVVIWTAWVLWTWRRAPVATVAWILGGLGPAVLLLAWNHALFGSPWTSTYSPGVLNPTFARDVLFHPPSLRKLFELTFGPARGWFYATPVFAFVLGGMALAPRLRHRWPELLPSAAAVVAILAVLASWNSWHGGNATGPRYLLWAMPFAVLLIVPVALRLPRLVLAFGVLSAVLMLAVTFTEPLLPTYQDTDPLLGGALPVLLGRADTHTVSLGSLLGLSPALTFALFLLIWLAAGIRIVYWLRADGLESDAGNGPAPPATPAAGAGSEGVRPARAPDGS
jgi:hypothetical protein